MDRKLIYLISFLIIYPAFLTNAENTRFAEYVIDRVPDFKHWQLVAKIKLSQPDIYSKYHPQGMVKIKDIFYVSASKQHAADINKNSALEEAFLLKYRIDVGKKLLNLLESTKLNKGRELYSQPGGLNLFEGRLYTPLTCGKNGPSYVVSINPKEITETRLESPKLNCHFGAILVNRYISLIDGNTGLYTSLFAEGYHLYHYEINVYDYEKFFPKGATYKYQDCKNLGGAIFVCGGVFDDEGVISFLELNYLKSPVEYKVLKKINVPKVKAEYILGKPQFLTRNPMEYEIIKDQYGMPFTMLFYFIPHDSPDAELFVYRADLR